MTLGELKDNLDALGIGAGSSVRDALEGNERLLVALINRGIYDVLRVRGTPGDVREITINDTDDTRIDLDDSLSDLLPYIVASFLYLEENPAVSKYYRSQYEDRRDRMIQREYKGGTTTVQTNGW